VGYPNFPLVDIVAMNAFNTGVALRYHSSHQGTGAQQATFGYPEQQRALADSSNRQAMFTQFRAQYPTGSLISELAAIQDGTYVVRVLVQVGGATLATGLAADTSVEVAEDRARLRALEALGRPNLVADGLSHSSYELQVQLMTSQPPVAPSLSAYGESNRTLPEPRLANAPALESQEVTEVEPDSEGLLFEMPASQPSRTVPLKSRRSSNSPQPAVSTPAPSNGRKAVSSDPAASVPPAQPGASPGHLEPENSLQAVDLSDVIAQTSIEMKRLGWTEAQGRTYLQKTYGKRSRQKLTDEELFEFLEYLESLPSPDESPF
jgi:hypothetical protein